MAQGSCSPACLELSFVPVVRLQSFCKCTDPDRCRREESELICQPWETQLDESSDLGHLHPGYMLNGQQAGIYLSPMQSSQQSAMYIYSQPVQGGQTTGYNAYYSQRPPYNYNTSPNEISQGMYSVNLQDTYSNSNAGPSYHMPTTSYVPQFNRPSKPEDKLFGDLVNMAKTKQNKIPPSNTGDL